MNLYSFLPFKALGTLINLTTCYCQVEHIHLLFQSVYSSISLSFHPFRPYFITFKETFLPVFILLGFQQLKLNLHSFILAVKPSLTRSLISLFIKCQGCSCFTVQCYYRFSHFHSEEHTQYMYFFRARYTVQSRVNAHPQILGVSQSEGGSSVAVILVGAPGAIRGGRSPLSTIVRD